MDLAADWKRYYAAERERMGTEAMLALLDDAEPLPLRPGGALMVPHTRLEITGRQIARAVATVLASGADTVLALGVLHGARRSDRERVAAARAGDAAARADLRGVHREDGIAAEEFSLDAFTELLALAAAREGRHIEVIRRYPFLVGDDPRSLPGLDELHQLLTDGALLVATTDPIHHGHAYDTPPADCLDAHEPSTQALARSLIDEQLTALATHDFAHFARLTEQHKSDFRDTGPVMAELLGPGLTATIHDLELVDYADALGAPSPSWVAGALITV